MNAIELAMSRHRRRPGVVVVSSRYRCRVHPDEPVTVRGTGCARCAAGDRPAVRVAVSGWPASDAALATVHTDYGDTARVRHRTRRDNGGTWTCSLCVTTTDYPQCSHTTDAAAAMPGTDPEAETP